MSLAPGEFAEWTVYTLAVLALVQLPVVVEVLLMRRASRNVKELVQRNKLEEDAQALEEGIPIIRLLRGAQALLRARSRPERPATHGIVRVLGALSLSIGAAVLIASGSIVPPSPVPRAAPLVFVVACLHVALASARRAQGCLALIGAYTGSAAILCGLGIVDAGWLLMGVGWTLIGAGLVVGAVAILRERLPLFGIGGVMVGAGMVAHGCGEVLALGATTGGVYIAAGVLTIASGFSLSFSQSFAIVACFSLSIGIGGAPLGGTDLRTLLSWVVIGGLATAGWAIVVTLRPCMDLHAASIATGGLLALSGTTIVMLGRNASGFGLLALGVAAFTAAAAIRFSRDLQDSSEEAILRISPTSQ